MTGVPTNLHDRCSLGRLSPSQPAGPSLSTFPSTDERGRLIDRRNREAIRQTNCMSIGAKRNCFLALRSEEQEIHPSSIFMPLGITVGELAVSQVLFTSDKERK